MVFRDVPFKNYVKYGIIILLSLAVCVVLFILQINWNNWNDDFSKLRNKVSEINATDVDDYINENDEVLLYFGVVHDDNSEKIEEGLVKSIEKDNLDFIYVNITDLKNKKEYFKSFNEKYSKGKKLENYPAFIYIKNKEIVDIVQRDDRYLEMEEVTNFINTNEIKGEKNA